MASEVCATCHEPLLVEVEPDSDFEDSKAIASSNHESVLDDVELACGCHYHWECFMESYTITQCPTCSQDISSLSTTTGQQQVLCTVRNEGGEQVDYDILPPATEEAYLRAYPEERKGHAFLEFCREGDIDAVMHLIKDDDDDDDDDIIDHDVVNDNDIATHKHGNRDGHDDDDNTNAEGIDILRYQGTFEGIEGSGLHVAIRYNQEEIAWLMLALASQLEWPRFPPHLLAAMEGIGLSQADRREVNAGKGKGFEDVRGLLDASGRTPLALAQEVGGLWTKWIESGVLAL